MNKRKNLLSFYKKKTFHLPINFDLGSSNFSFIASLNWSKLAVFWMKLSETTAKTLLDVLNVWTNCSWTSSPGLQSMSGTQILEDDQLTLNYDVTNVLIIAFIVTFLYQYMS